MTRPWVRGPQRVAGARRRARSRARRRPRRRRRALSDASAQRSLASVHHSACPGASPHSAVGARTALHPLLSRPALSQWRRSPSCAPTSKARRASSPSSARIAVPRCSARTTGSSGRRSARTAGRRSAIPSATGSSRPSHPPPGRVLVAAATCEHLVEVYAEVADAILRHCPRVRRLATSREPLGISGETIYRVPSLSLPAEGRDSTSSDAVALFLDRARTQGTGRRLDGLPLARELAAVRLRSLSLEDLHHRLDRRFRLLAGGSRSALSSGQPRRATVETVSRPAASPG